MKCGLMSGLMICILLHIVEILMTLGFEGSAVSGSEISPLKVRIVKADSRQEPGSLIVSDKMQN
jgi:hypothetical protein